MADASSVLLFNNKVSHRNSVSSDIRPPKINAGRMNRHEMSQQQNNGNKRHFDNRQKHTPASNIPCPACSFSNKDIHKMLATIHPPNGDPNKCCFRGPSFNCDKDMREKVHQYNLKNPKDIGQNLNKQDRQHIPPKKADLPGSKVNFASPEDTNANNEMLEQTPMDDHIYVEDFIYDTNPDDYIHMSEDPTYVEEQENSDLHEVKTNKNFIDEVDNEQFYDTNDTDLPSLTFRMTTVQL